MPEDRRRASRETQDAEEMRAAAERVGALAEVPRSLQAALAHTLYAAATELDNGRPLPVEVRRAARHAVRAIGEVGTQRG